MDNLKRERTQLRRHFTTFLKEVDTVLKDEAVSKIDLISVFNIFNDKADRLFHLDEKVKIKWLEIENFNEDEFSNDMDLTESYRNQWVAMKMKVDLMLSTTERKGDISSVVNETKRNFRFPKLELKRFDDNIKNWLGFWGQFKKIHDNDSIDADDKFQYLLQATEEGSSARDLVASFPPFGENYYNAIEQLKSRFAKDELLIQIYVCELLN